MSGEDIALSVKGLYKDFLLPHERKNSLKEWVLHFKRPSFERMHALHDINFDVRRGEFFGVVGRNGSGKSTLLKLIGGIYQPTKGTITVNGTLTPFIELGIGFNPELTGRENVFMNGAILGLTHKEIEEKYDEIVAFAELEKFMDQKLKNYSSGMQVRLAFSISIRAHNDILLIDEVLAVGDVAFQEKCFAEFNKIKASGRTVVFISHDLGSVEKFCDRVMIINDSKVVDIGAPQKMVLKYSNIMAGQSFNQTPEHTNVGTGKVRILGVDLLVEGKKQQFVTEDQAFTLRTHYEVEDKGVGKLNFGVSITTESNISLIAPNTVESKFPLEKLPSKGYIDAKFPSNPLSTGRYSVVAGVFNENSTVTHDYASNLLNFKVTGKGRHGIINLEPRWSVEAET